MHVYGFQDKLTRSKERRILDIAALHRAFPNATDVRAGTEQEDRAGADYVVEVSGRSLLVDVKARERGCSRYWRCDENGCLIAELAIELVSVDGARTGWSLDWSKKTDFIMFTFDPEDHPSCYVIPALALRQLVERYELTMRDKLQTATQQSDYWTSECVFVPIDKLKNGIAASWKYPYGESSNGLAL